MSIGPSPEQLCYLPVARVWAPIRPIRSGDTTKWATGVTLVLTPVESCLVRSAALTYAGGAASRMRRAS